MTSNPPDAFTDGLRWVRRLAHRLVADPGLADDLTQETMLVAMERSPLHAQSVRGWLARVLRNRLWLHRRTEGRRQRREERSARPEGTPSDDELLTRVETVEHIGAAVRELPEIYRRVIILRYFDELPAPEIARRLGVPASTVRTRLERGHALLRVHLDAEYGDRERWRQAILPLVGLADVAATTTITSITTGSWLIGMKKLASAVILLVLLLGGYWGGDRLGWWNGEDSDTPSKNVASIGDATSASEADAPTTELLPSADDSKNPPTEGGAATSASKTAGDDGSPTTAAKVAVVSGVIYRSDDASLEGARVFLWGGGQPGSLVDAEGRFRIESPYEMGTNLCLEQDGKKLTLDAKVRPIFDDEVVLEIMVEVANSVSVECIDSLTQRPIPHAKLTVRKSTNDGQAAAIFTSADKTGLATFDYLPDSAYKIEVEHPDYTSTAFDFRLPGDHTVTCPLDPARPLIVTFSRFDEHPVPDKVYLQLYNSSGANFFLEGIPDATGEFTVNAPPAGQWHGEMFGSSDFPRVRFNLQVADGDDAVRLPLELPARGKTTIVGRVLDAIGDPIPSAGVIRLGGSDATAQPDGSVELSNVKPGRHRASWIVGNGNERAERYLATVNVPKDGELYHEFVIAGSARLEVVLTDLTAEHRAGHFIVQLHSLDGEADNFAWGVGPAHRPLAFDRLPLGRYHIETQLERNHERLPDREIEIEDAERPTVLEIALPEPATLTFEFVGPQRAAIPAVARVELRREPHLPPRISMVEIRDGEGSIDLYDPGEFELTVHLAGFEPLTASAEVSLGKIERLSFTPKKEE